MSLKKLLGTMGSAWAFSLSAAALPSCNEKDPVSIVLPPIPMCDYGAYVEETDAEHRARLGENYDHCKEVIPGHNDARIKKLNIVFVGINYNYGEFKERIKELVSCDQSNEGILSMEPFTSNYDNINFWYANETAFVDKYVIGEHEAARAPASALSEACDVPSRTVVALVNWDFRSRASKSPFSRINVTALNLDNLKSLQGMFPDIGYDECSAIVQYACAMENPDPYAELCSAIQSLRGNEDPSLDQYLCALITDGGNAPLGKAYISGAARASTINHELGHTIFGFYEEYLEEGRMDPNSQGSLDMMLINGQNCFPAPTEELCESTSLWGGPCYQGCNTLNELVGIPVWRSVDNGIMRSISASTFGEWDNARICYTFFVLANNAMGICEEYLPVSIEKLPALPHVRKYNPEEMTDY